MLVNRYLVLVMSFAFSITSHAKTNLPKEASAILAESIRVSHTDMKDIAEQEADEMRLNAVAVDAYSWGIQEGAYNRNTEIQEILNEHSFTINKTISLAKFVIDGKILMPTVLEADRIFVKKNEREGRTVAMSYTLDKPPRVVSQVPTWRDYLLRQIAKPRKPIRNSYPRTSEEAAIWAREFERGWFRGVEQANSIFNSDLNKLNKDVAGLYRFRFLLAQNVVTLPKIKKDKSSVMLLDSGKTIYLNNYKYSIQLDSQFNKVTDWKPVFNKGGAHEIR